MPGPKTGALAPDFTLPADDGGTLSLSALRGQKVVLYFYPADNTETCTIEAIDFSSRQPDFAAAGAIIVGVSPDSAKSHQRFKAKHGLGIRLVADEDLKSSANTVCGPKNRCSGGSSWGSSGRRS
jgi:peroxiredoxin Q/BCP